MPSCNVGNVLFMIQIPVKICEGASWKDFYGVLHVVKTIGSYKVAGKQFTDCVLIEFDSTETTKDCYCGNGKGYYILAREYGLVEFQFRDNKARKISFKAKENKRYSVKSTVEGIVTNGTDPIEGLGVMLSTRKIDQIAITDSEGRFSLSYWGEATSLRIGAVDEYGDIIKDSKIEYYKYSGKGSVKITIKP